MSKINTDINTIESIAIRVLAEFGGQLGAGQVAKAVNTVLAVYNVEKANKDSGVMELYQVTPQMMNNYGKNGLIDGQKRQSMAKIKFAAEVVLAFIVKFVDRQINGTKSTGSTSNITKLADLIKAELAAEADEVEETEEADELE